MNFTVGQVIWAVGISRPSLQVFQIVEEITKKTIGAEIISYILISANSQDKLLNLEDLLNSNHVFKSSEEAQVFMMKSAAKAIDDAIERTKSIAIQSFPIKEKENLEAIETIELSDSTETAKIQLEDGTIANITLPKVRR